MFGKALLVLMIAVVVAVEIYAVVAVVRSTVNKKWAWILLALVGVTRFSMAWETGAVAYNPIYVSLLGFGVLQNGAGPWIVSVSFPVGAVMSIRKVKGTEGVAEADSAELEEVAAGGRGDHAV